MSASSWRRPPPPVTSGCTSSAPAPPRSRASPPHTRDRSPSPTAPGRSPRPWPRSRVPSAPTPAPRRRPSARRRRPSRRGPRSPAPSPRSSQRRRSRRTGELQVDARLAFHRMEDTVAADTGQACVVGPTPPVQAVVVPRHGDEPLKTQLVLLQRVGGAHAGRCGLRARLRLRKQFRQLQGGATPPAARRGTGRSRPTRCRLVSSEAPDVRVLVVNSSANQAA